MATLVETLHRWVEETPDKILFTFLTDGEATGEEMTFSGLRAAADAVAVQIAEVTEFGDRVLLLYQPGLDYITAFFACLYSGRIAVPVYPPNPRRLEQTLPRLMHIVSDAKPTAVATTSMIRGLAEGLLGSMGFADLAWVATDSAPQGESMPPVNGIEPGSVAFLQYTSGSTAKPRGVRVTHDNLLSNSGLISEALRADTNTVGVSWLPLYHDMGLIGKVIAPATIGCSVVLMSPLDYLRRPTRWLNAISRFGGTVSAAPNFAYDLCTRKVTEEELAQMDLSTWQVALNGAEPVLSETLEGFARRFGPVGFNPEAFLPAYGLAESTLIVTGAMHGVKSFNVATEPLEQGKIEQVDAGERVSRRLISSGCVPGEGHLTRVVEPERRVALPDAMVGEIWVSGPSVADGYWERPELSAATFGAALADDDGRRYLRTGDLGFMIQGELVVTGRRKDLMILRGRNIYPQDVEATVSKAHEAVRPGGMAVFSVDGPDGEIAVVVTELERRTKAGRAGDDRRREETLPDHEVAEAPRVDDVAEAIRKAVLRDHEVDVSHVVLIKPGSVPKTSSGKIQRRECRRQFLENELDEFGRFTREIEKTETVPVEAPEIWIEELSFVQHAERVSRLTEYLTSLVAFVVGCGVEVVEARPLMAVGLDSLKAMELQYAIEEKLGVRLFPSLLLGGATVADVAEELANANYSAAGERQGLSDVSSEVFAEPSEGSLTETIRFEVDGVHHGIREVDDRLGFSEDADPWGPTPTVEFSIEDERDDALSWNEKGFWLYQKTFPKSWAPNLYYAAELPANTTLEVIQRVTARIVARHENLNSRYVTIGGAPMRFRAPDADPEVTVVAAIGWNDERLTSVFERHASLPFDVDRGPVIRFVYFERDSRPILLMAMHHIVADFWSLERLIWEVGDEVAGREVEVPQVTYSDFVNWQDKLLDSDRGRWSEDYWREKLSGDIPKLQMPRSAMARGTGYGRAYRSKIDAPLVSAIDRLASERNTTRYTLLLAVYQVLLHRWSGQSDVMVGAVAAGRTRRFFRDVLGMFANPLPIRSTIESQTKFSDHLATTQNELLHAMDAQEYPLQAMLERFEIKRDGVDNPIVQTLFASEQPREGGLEIGGEVGGLRTLDLGLAGTVFDFTVMVYQGVDGGEIRLQYNDAKYDEEMIARLAESFEQLIRDVVANPDVPVGTADLISSTTRSLVAKDWSCGRAVEVGEPCIHEMFEKVAAQNPTAVAIVADGEEWTYEELNKRANRLARNLIELGVRPGSVVGVEVERSPALIAALYGVLKAGAGYVALQPSLPEKRLQYMAENARVQVTLTDDPSRSEVGGKRIDVAVMAQQTFADSNPGVAVDSHSLAYILYTSGTTGLPKGVMLPHSAVRNLVTVIGEQYPVGAGDAILQKTPYSFDISVSEIFNPLANGARLVMTRSGASRDPSYLRDLINEQRVTVLRATPTELASLLEVDGISSCASVVRRVLSCGEALTPAVCSAFADKWAGVELINLWGPTEACVYASWWPVDSEHGDTVPIGKPLPNYRLYALDDLLELLPLGLQGELFAGGDSLARGYHDMPRKTALSYLPDPFAAEPGARMYKSGDLVSWNSDGDLEFFGRKDSQVQLRGMRVELGELEAILEQHPGVRQAAVRALEADDGRVEALAAYVVLDSASKPDVAALRAHLGEQLEESKIPGQFIEVEEMPLTPSGKIDRKALPDPDERMRSETRTAPTTPAERRLASLWRKHLRIEDVGVHENFFEIGGHSLLAVRIQHDIMKMFGLDVPLGMLFENPTIGSLGAKLDGADGLEFTPIERHEYGNEAPLSAGQQLMWIQQFLEGHSATYHSPGVFRLRGSVDVAALKRALTRLVGRHEVLRTVYPLRGDEPVQHILPPPETIEVLVEDLRETDAPAARARTRAAEFSAAPFDLTTETSFRVLMIQVADREWVLCLLFHHIAFDEWSVDVLFEEIEALYRQERGEDAGDADDARIEDWKQTYQVAYRNLTAQLEAGEIEDPTFNTDGWLSSFTGERYEQEEMREWLQSTLERVRGLKLGRTLEIGCGTGMILFEMAPHATEYVGVDLTHSALAYIDAVRDQMDEDLSHVSLIHGRADEIGDIEGEFDTIIINSVAQYFPHHKYLEEVIRAACSKLRAGGRFYMGDLRDARTGFAFHAAVNMVRATPETTAGSLRERTAQRMLNDDELMISPQYLAHIARGLPNISHIDFNYQRAQHRTEMSIFRFGATLHACAHEPYRAPEAVLSWKRDSLNSSSLGSRLGKVDESLLVVGIPHARLEEFGRLTRWVNSASAETPYSVFEDQEWGDCVEPDTFRDLGEELGFRVTVSPSNDGEGLMFDALFERELFALSDVRPLTPLTSQATPLPVPAAPSEAPEDLAGAADLWRQMLEQEAVRTYSRGEREQDAPVVLGEPELQYADFAIWQREQYDTTDFVEGISYWKQHLTGARPDLAWPIGREPGRSRPAGYIQHTWGRGVSELVADYARERGSSEFVVLYAAFTAFLAEYCGQDDLTIGVGTTLRQRPEFRDLLGYMLNMLPLRTNVALDASFDDWFEDARTHWEESQSHQWIPLEKIVDAMGAERETAGLALYDVMLAYVPRNHLRRSSAVTDDFVRNMAGLEVSPFDYGGVPDALCSLFVSMFKVGEDVGTEFEYDAGRFDRWQMERLAQQFELAVEQALKSSANALDKTMQLAEDEPGALLGEWTRGPRFKAADLPLHVQFERWAGLQPSKKALTFDGDSWTYGELETRANRLARQLAEAGVRIGTRVGVTVERSPELIVALLGVMKAGGAYVAMEPDLPASRLMHIANDAEAPFVVVDEAGRKALGEGGSWTCIDVAVCHQDGSDEPLDLDVEGEDLVYMLYTSGTTGNPKGVMVPHSAVANHVGWLAEAYGCTEDDVFLLKSSYGFDMSVSELFGPLCLGGTMAIAKPEGHRDPRYLVDAVERFGVTCLRVVPTTLNLLLTEPDAKRMETSLRWVSLGGEALSMTVRDRFFDTFESVELHNPFGITETCVDVSFWECPRDRRGQEVSLGKPMGNYDAYALDEWFQPVPQNRPGEVFVGGPGVTYGYWNMPIRTALVFVPDPYSDKPGGRMYASGDLGRWDDNGELRYQGRKDDQIQLNGIRIELGEVEAYLEASPGVLQGAVRTVNESEGRAEGLIAYIVPEEGVEPDIGGIRKYLEGHLRRAVVPTQFVTLDKMPRRPSGKIDRDALPDPSQQLGGAAATGDTEEKLVAIWAEVLGVESVGRDANFFEVGGTSLKAIKVFRMLEQQFDVKFEVVELFAYPTIESLASFLDGRSNEKRESAAEEQRQRGRRRRESAQLGAVRRGRRKK